jgi:DNA polymerase-3 subunit alpha
MTLNYTELHLHDHHSALDGLNTPAEYMKRAKEIGMTHLAQTNHGTLAGHREFQSAAKEAGIIPILGVEGYISETDRFDRRAKAKRQDGTNVYNHIILLAQDEAGLQNLNKLNELAWTEGFYHKPRFDMELLEEHSNGLIILSGCLSGLLSKAIERGDMQAAIDHAKNLSRIAPGRFYIEVQGHNPPELNEMLLTIADRLDIPAVATSDCHYAREEDLWVEEALLILSTNPKKRMGDFDFSKSQKLDYLERYNYMYPDRTMTFQEFDLFLHKAEQHQTAFAKQGITRTDIIENTMRVAESIGEYPYHQGLDLLPQPKGEDPDEILERKCREGMERRGFKGIKKYEDRLTEELEIVKGKNFSTYFLIVADAVQWAKKKGIMVGPGRGSGAGSLVNYVLDITDIDPIEYGLLFFRFIDPERDDYPDIDMDFEDKRRDEVKEYLRRKYKNVASIATFSYFKDKNVIKDAARVLRVPVADVNRATKNVDAPPGHDFFDVFKDSPQGQEFNAKYPDVMALAGALRGRIRSAGMHAAGIVMSKMELSDVSPIQTATNPADKQGARISLLALDMDEAADIGLIKFDFLGLKTLAVIADCVKLIKERHNIDIDLARLPLNDKNVYAMLAEGNTKGVFQCEATPYTKLLMKMNVDTFNDLAVSNALIRPGAMNVFGNSYLKRKAGKEKSTRIHPLVDKYMEESFYLPIYQEQSMRLVSDLAGMGMSMANKVRKITAKKQDVALLAKYREQFIAGATANVGAEMAEFLWTSIEETASYQFNLSHSVAYSKVSYWTAWLKHYYPKEFMVSILNNESDKDSITDYMIETKRLGMKILLPHINKSQPKFSIEGDDIRMGLSNIKFISEITAAKLIDRVPYGGYNELEAWVTTKGNGLNTRCLTGMNAIGAARFEDNPLHGNERSNFYEYLGIPEFDLGSVPGVIRAQLTPIKEEKDEDGNVITEGYEEKGVYLIRGMVRDIMRRDTWARVDILDNTGNVGIFTDEDTEIAAGSLYVFLVQDNRIAKWCLDEELTENKDDPFVKYLWELDYPDMPDSMYKVVHFHARKSKKGTNFANMIVADNQKNLTSVIVFDQVFKKAQVKCAPGAVVDIELERMKDGSITLRNIL